MTSSSHGLKTEPIEPFIAALEHPLRSRILTALSERSATASEIAALINEPPAKVRYHLRALAKSGLIGLREATDRRGTRERKWIASTPQVMQDEQIRRLSPEQVRAATFHYLRLLFADATAAVRDGTFDRRPEHCMVRFRPRIDEQGWAELVGIFYRAVAEVTEVTERSSRRLETSGADPVMVGASLLLFEMADSTPPIPGSIPFLDEPRP